MDKLFENENAYSETTLLKVRRVSFTTLALPNSQVSKFELNWTSPLPPSLWVPFKDTLRNFPLPLSSVIERKYPTLVSTLQSLPCLPYMRALTFPPALPVQFTTLPRYPNLSTSSIIFRMIRTSILVKTWLLSTSFSQRLSSGTYPVSSHLQIVYLSVGRLLTVSTLKKN